MMSRTNSQLLSMRPAAAIEALEGRRLLSAVPAGTASLVNGDLNVYGTRYDDQIMVMAMPNEMGVEMLDVSLNGTSIGSFNPADVKRIVARGGKGNDFIMAQTALPLRVHCFSSLRAGGRIAPSGEKTGSASVSTTPGIAGFAAVPSVLKP